MARDSSAQRHKVTRRAASLKVALAKRCPIPLRQQLSEQIVYLITTGAIRSGDALPSVRALAQRLSIHHNTVSAAYSDLVRREWLTRRKGNTLVVASSVAEASSTLDALIADTLERARLLGFSRRELEAKLLERLQGRSVECLLIVEEEAELRAILQREMQGRIGVPVKSCSPEQLEKQPELAMGAKIAAPAHLAMKLSVSCLSGAPCLPLQFSRAAGLLKVVHELSRPSIIAVVSVSRSLLRTARGVFASAVGEVHTLREVHVQADERVSLRGVDLAFCDSIAIENTAGCVVVPYSLLEQSCIEDVMTACKAVD